MGVEETSPDSAEAEVETKEQQKTDDVKPFTFESILCIQNICLSVTCHRIILLKIKSQLNRQCRRYLIVQVELLNQSMQ